MATNGWSQIQLLQLELEISSAECVTRSTERLNCGYLLYRAAMARVYRQPETTEECAPHALPGAETPNLLIFPQGSSPLRRGEHGRAAAKRGAAASQRMAAIHEPAGERQVGLDQG